MSDDLKDQPGEMLAPRHYRLRGMTDKGSFTIWQGFDLASELLRQARFFRSNDSRAPMQTWWQVKVDGSWQNCPDPTE